MSSRLHIRNFKCFDHADVELKRLNVLCGRNGAGKSTLTQALLLHRAALYACRAGASEVALNGPVGLNLGTVGDIVHRSSRSAKLARIGLGFDDGSGSVSFTFEPDDHEEEANALKLRVPERDIRIPQSPWEFIYLSAERIGPRVSQERLSNLPRTELGLGEFGEYSAEVLQHFERLKIREAVLHPEERIRPKREQNRRLLRNLELWLSTMFGPLQVRVDSNGTYAPPSIVIRSASSLDDWVLSTNFGFGVTYSLPIILAGLLVPENGIVIVDGPEAHLHPAAQTSMARFLATIAASNCTVLVETHSDHIVDGVRLAVHSGNGVLQPHQCIFLNFDRSDASSVSITPISIDNKGGLSAWPRGFFDQQSSNLRALANRMFK